MDGAKENLMEGFSKVIQAGEAKMEDLA